MDDDSFYNELPEFDTIRLKEFIQEETNISIITYLITIVLYILSFIYLFKNDSTEYIVWILIFILNFITPMIWFTDMMKVLEILSMRMPDTDSKIFQYGFLCLALTSFLTIVSLFMILFKNEKIRNVKNKLGSFNNSDEMPNLKTNIRTIEKRDRRIAIIYTTIVSVVWGIIAFTFSEYLNNSTEHKKKIPFGSRIKILMDFIPDILSFIDSTIHYYSQQIPLSSIVKSSILYIITFVAVFFGIFAKLNYNIQPGKAGKQVSMEITNMTPLFTERFDIEFKEIRHFVIFLVWLFSTFGFSELLSLSSRISNCLPSFDSKLNTILTVIFGIISFSLAFSNQEEWFPKHRIKDIVFFFLCILFGLVSAAPLTGIVELIFSLLRSSANINMDILILGKNSVTLYYISFLIISSVIFLTGMSEDWIDRDGKSMRTLLVLLVTMTISLFCSLSTEYNVFRNLYNVIGFLLRLVMKYIAPIGILILSIILFYYSHKNYQKVKNMPHDRLVTVNDPIDTPSKTKNTIEDQKKIRNVLKNTIVDFTQYFNIGDRVDNMKNVLGV